MDLKQIREIVTSRNTQKYRVKLVDGSSKIVRMWNANGCIYIIGQGKKYYGHELCSWYEDYSKWIKLSLVKHREKDYYKLFMKRANDGLKMLTESGLWSEIKESIEFFLQLSESEQRQLVEDIRTDWYKKFYCQTFDGGKYSWVKSHQIFESFARNVCWKYIAWHKLERKAMSAEVANCIKNGKHYHRRWTNGYDNTIEIEKENGIKRGWYSEEYRGCGNGHYYLMFDATHAIFYEND